MTSPGSSDSADQQPALHELYASIQRLAEELQGTIERDGFDDTLEAELTRLHDLVRHTDTLSRQETETSGLERARNAARVALSAFESLLECTRQQISHLQSEQRAVTKLRNLNASPRARGNRRVLADA